MKRLNYLIILLILSNIAHSQTSPGYQLKRKTIVSVSGGKFLINGIPTFQGRYWKGYPLEGLLPNSRMVQGIFDDLNKDTRHLWNYPDTKTWDADRNTNEFIRGMPIWRKKGLLAFTINLQGGSPQGYSKYQPWENSAIDETGNHRKDYMNRLEKILDRCDELGMVAILGIFYFGQDERIKDEAAVKSAVQNTVKWLSDRRYTNVLIEINNECNVKYDHAILQPGRIHELIEMAKRPTDTRIRYLVSTSYGGGSIPSPAVVKSADFILVHGNGVKDPAKIIDMVNKTRKVEGYSPKPIVFKKKDFSTCLKLFLSVRKIEFASTNPSLAVILADHVDYFYCPAGLLLGRKIKITFTKGK